MNVSFVGLLIGVLATWRLTTLLHGEDGPFDVFARLRADAAGTMWGRMLECFWCTSLWAAVPVTVLLWPGWTDGAVLWLAVSGGAILVDRALPPRATWREEDALPPPPAPETEHGS